MGRPGRAPRARLALLLALALVAIAVVSIPYGARRTIAKAILSASSRRGLLARWAALEVRYPSSVVLARLRLTDAERGGLVFRAETLSVAIDPLSIPLLRPRASRIEPMSSICSGLTMIRTSRPAWMAKALSTPSKLWAMVSSASRRLM